MNKEVIIICDLGFGDAGKGSITDYLTRLRDAHTVVRFNGGAQAAHNVIDPEGRQHLFAQFGSGTLIPGTKTHLSRFIAVNPLSMMAEEKHLQEIGVNDAFVRTTIDQEALVTTPFHIALNRLKEAARGNGRHGSTGMGVSETVVDYRRHGEKMLKIGDLVDRQTIIKKLKFLQDLKRSELGILRASLPSSEEVGREVKVIEDPNILKDCADIYQTFGQLVNIVDRNYLKGVLNTPGTIIFEGAQGILLDEEYGFRPYITRGKTTFENAENLLKEQSYQGLVTRLGLLRAYSTRHGPGPFITEDQELTQLLPDTQNDGNIWQGGFRVGYLDLVAASYAIEVAGGADSLGITCLDRLAQIPEWKLCTSYNYSGNEDITSLFDLEGSLVKKIKLQKPADLVHQERLTKDLFKCLPEYENVEQVLDGYIEGIQSKLKTPVWLTSFGPRSGDKRIYK